MDQDFTVDDMLEDAGLQMLGSERHDTRRVDRQLRGGVARLGDLGLSQSYLSLEDDLMRLLGSEYARGQGAGAECSLSLVVAGRSR